MDQNIMYEIWGLGIMTHILAFMIGMRYAYYRIDKKMKF